MYFHFFSRIYNVFRKQDIAYQINYDTNYNITYLGYNAFLRPWTCCADFRRYMYTVYAADTYAKTFYSHVTVIYDNFSSNFILEHIIEWRYFIYVLYIHICISTFNIYTLSLYNITLRDIIIYLYHILHKHFCMDVKTSYIYIKYGNTYRTWRRNFIMVMLTSIYFFTSILYMFQMLL